MNKNLALYYKKRAKEYDRVYENPDEQEDLRQATAIFQALFAGKNVLEIACGTGYWTGQIAQTAQSVHATDINESMLDIAMERNKAPNTTFALADLYSLRPERPYDALFGGFIWSHIPLQGLDAFMDQWKGLIAPGGTVAFIDSNYVAGTNHDAKRISHTDEYGNTYQTRTLGDGTAHQVLKNFPTEAWMTQNLARVATDVRFISLKYYWVLVCRLTSGK